MAALRDAYLLDVDKSSRPLQRFQEGARVLKAAEEIVAVAQGLQKEFWDFWVGETKNLDGRDLMTLDYQKLNVVLWGVVKSLQKRVESLEKKKRGRS